MASVLDEQILQSHRTLQSCLKNLFNRIDFPVYLDRRNFDDGPDFYTYLENNGSLSKKLCYKVLKYYCFDIDIDSCVFNKYIYGFLKKRKIEVDLTDVVQTFVNQNRFLYKIRKRKTHLKPIKKMSWRETIDKQPGSIVMDSVNTDVQVFVKQVDYGPFLYYQILLPQYNEYTVNEYYDKACDNKIIDNQFERGNIVSNNYLIKLCLEYIALSDIELIHLYSESKFADLVEEIVNFVKLPNFIVQFFTNSHFSEYKSNFDHIATKINKMINNQIPFNAKQFRQLLIEGICNVWASTSRSVSL